MVGRLVPFPRAQSVLSSIYMPGAMKLFSVADLVFNADTGKWAFNFTRNTTNCNDGTYCPNPNNSTCCFNKQGRPILSYHNDNLIPKSAAAFSSYYSAGRYTIPTSSPGASLTDLPSASGTELPASPTPADNSSSIPPESSDLGSGAKAGIGIGAAAGASALAVAAFLLIRRHRARRQEQSLDYMKSSHPDGIWLTEAHGAQKHEMAGDSTPLQDMKKKQETIGQPVRMEMDAASPERTRFHELGVDR